MVILLKGLQILFLNGILHIAIKWVSFINTFPEISFTRISDVLVEMFCCIMLLSY